MNLKDKERIIDRYNKRMETMGLNISGLASGTEERRRLRFQTLSEIGIKSGDSVLDLGCGFGDFFSYLQSENINVHYTGYDINPRIIEEAIRRHESEATTFKVLDVSIDSFPVFDYIVSSSSFNLPLQFENNYSFIERILKICYEHSNKGIAFDFLSSYADFYNEEGFHYEPEKLFKIAKSISKRVNLRHDYPLFEFNVYILKDFNGWK